MRKIQLTQGQEKEAARAYNVAAEELHGEFAYLNQIEDTDEQT